MSDNFKVLFEAGIDQNSISGIQAELQGLSKGLKLELQPTFKDNNVKQEIQGIQKLLDKDVDLKIKPQVDRKALDDIGKQVSELQKRQLDLNFSKFERSNAELLKTSKDFSEQFANLSSQKVDIDVGSSLTSLRELNMSLKELDESGKMAKQSLNFEDFKRPKMLDDFKSSLAPFQEFIDKSEELKKAQESITSKIQIVDPSQKTELQSLSNEIKNFTNEVKSGASDLEKTQIFELKGRPKMIEDLNSIQSKFKETAETSKEFQETMAKAMDNAEKVQAGDKTGLAQHDAYKQALTGIGQASNEAVAGINQVNLGFSNGTKQLTNYVAHIFTLRAAINQMKQAFEYVKEIDSSLTEIQMVTQKSAGDVASWGKEYQNLARSLSVSNAEITSGAVGFVRQGLSQEEVLQRLATTTQFAKITNTDFNESVDLLTATVNGMNVDIERAADVMIFLGDATATSGQEIAKGLSKTAGTASALGVEFEKVASWIATISAKTRAVPESIGSSINMILARMSKLNEKGFDEIDGTKINDVAKALGKVDIELQGVGQSGQREFRNFGDVLDELGGKWHGLDKNTKAYLATTIAGARQQSNFMQLMEGYADSMDLYQQSLNVSGTADSKYEIYLASVQAKIDDLKNSIQELYSTMASKGSIESIISGLKAVVDILTVLVDKFGLLGTAMLAVSAKSGIQLLIQGLIPAFLGLAGATGVATTQVTLFGLALNLALPQLALLAGVLVGVPLLLGGLAKAFSGAGEAAEKSAKGYAESKNTLESLYKLQSLAKTADATGGKEGEKERLEIGKALAKIYPTLADAEDEYGNAYIKNVDILNELITKEEELLAIREQNLKDNAGDYIKEEEKRIEVAERMIKVAERRRDALSKQVDVKGLDTEDTVAKIREQDAEIVKQNASIKESNANIEKYNNILDGTNQVTEEGLTLKQKAIAASVAEQAETKKSAAEVENLKQQLKDVGITDENEIGKILSGSIKELEEVVGNANLSPDQQAQADWEDLANSIEDTANSYNALQKVMDEYSQHGNLSADTVRNLITKYPEMREHIAKVGDEYVLLNSAVEKQNELAEQYTNSLDAMLENNYELGESFNIEPIENMSESLDNLKYDMENLMDSVDFDSMGLGEIPQIFEDLGQQLDDGKIKLSEYFDGITEGIANIDWGALDPEQVAELSSGLFEQMSNAYTELNSLFDNGSISTADYVNNLESLTKNMETMYAQANNLNLVNGEWVDMAGNVDSTAMSIRNALNSMGDMSGAVNLISQNTSVINKMLSSVGNTAQEAAVASSAEWQNFASDFAKTMQQLSQTDNKLFKNIASDIASETGQLASDVEADLVNSQSALYSHADSFAGALSSVQSALGASVSVMSSEASNSIGQVGSAIDGFQHSIVAQVNETAGKTITQTYDLPDGQGGMKQQKSTFHLPAFNVEAHGQGGSTGGGAKGGRLTPKIGYNPNASKTGSKPMASGAKPPSNDVLAPSSVGDPLSQKTGRRPSGGGGGKKGGGGGGKKGGGGGGKTKEEYKAEADAYERINSLIDQNSNKLKFNASVKKGMVPDVRRDIEMTRENLALEQQKQKLLHEKAQQIRQERAELEKTLSGQGFAFSGEGDSRFITNLENIQGKSKEVEESFKRYMDIALKELPELSSNWWEVQAAVNDIKFNDQFMRDIERMQDGMDILDRDLKNLKHQMAMIDDLDIFGAAPDVKQNAYTKQIELITQEIEILNTKHELAKVQMQVMLEAGLDPVIGKTKEYRAELEKLQDNLMSVAEAEFQAQQAYRQKIEEMRTNWIAERNKEYEDQRARLSALDKAQEEIVKIIRKRGELEKKEMQKRHKEEMDALRKRQKEIEKKNKEELDAYKKLIQDKLDALKDQWSEEDYQDNLKKEQEELIRMQKDYNELALDDSLSSRAKGFKLQEEIRKQEEKIAKLQKDKERKDTEKLLKDKLTGVTNESKAELDIQKEQHESEMEMLKERQEREKEAHEEAYNNAHVYAEARKSLMRDQVEYAEGSFMSIQDAFSRFSDEFGKGMGILGQVIQADFISELERANEAIKNMDYAMGNLKQKYASDYDVFGNGHLSKPREPGSGGSSGDSLADIRPDEFRSWSETDWQMYLRNKSLWETGSKEVQRQTAEKNERIRQKYGMRGDNYSYSDLMYEIERLKDKRRRSMASYDVGGFIPRDGVIMAHEQEMFVPAKYQKDLWNFIQSPNKLAQGNSGSGATQVIIQVEGNLDKSVIPDIERAVNKAIIKRDKTIESNLKGSGNKLRLK